MSADAVASITLGAKIQIKDLERFKFFKDAVTRTEKRFSQKTGKPIKDAVIVDEQATWGYKFDDENVASGNDWGKGRQNIHDIELAEVLSNYLGISVDYLSCNDEEELLVGLNLGEVDCGCYACFNLAGEPFTDFDSLPVRKHHIEDVIKNKLGLELVVGLMATLDVHD